MVPGFREFTPLYFRVTVILIGIIAFFFVLWAGQNIFLPLIFSMLVSILINPFVNFFINHRFPKILAIAVPLLFALLCMGGLLLFFSTQFNSFTDALPQLQKRFNELLVELVDWLNRNFHLNTDKVNEWIKQKTTEGIGNSNALIGDTVNRVTHFFVLVLLIPVFIFLLLFYKPLLLKFISKLFPVRLHEEVVDVLRQIKILIHQYLTGLLLEMLIVASLTAVGLFFLGIQSPILFGIITALLNTIPYVGVLIANITFATIALITKSPSSALFVLILYVTVQFIDNNIIVPRIVGSKVKINALATILTVLIGGELFGIAGMFLAIPVTAVSKVIFDRVKPLQPLGYLLGDNVPKTTRRIFRLKKHSSPEGKKI
jgi:predicted PurR-regulated permease PerM